uniref:(northern house mosquito) hypothetical protein n=1 Tax=Culex pipiens TaxID=7175 RepID=A0A8D8H2F2_CULPI
MIPLKWYTVELQMVENKKGNLSVMFRNYIYIKDKQGQGQGQVTTGWRCTRKNSGCLARVTTLGHNQLKIGLRPHNHPAPDQNKTAKKKKQSLPFEYLQVKREPI